MNGAIIQEDRSDGYAQEGTPLTRLSISWSSCMQSKYFCSWQIGPFARGHFHEDWKR